MIAKELAKEFFPIKDQQALEIICEISEIRHYKKRMHIYKNGEIQKNFYFLLKGAICLFYLDESGSEYTETFMATRGMCINTVHFKEMSLCSCETILDTDVLEIPVKQGCELIAAYPELNDQLMHYIMMAAEYQTYIDCKRIHLSADKKYRWFCKMWPEVEKSASNARIASFLGIRSESLSRLRKHNKEKDSALQTAEEDECEIMVSCDGEWNYEKLMDALRNRK